MIQVSKQSCPIPFTAIVTHHQRQRDSNCRTSNYQPKPFCALAEFFLGEQGYRISRLTTGWPQDPRTALPVQPPGLPDRTSWLVRPGSYCGVQQPSGGMPVDVT
jgi:hypothetical protein